VIAGAASPELVQANVAAAEWKLTAEEVGEVNGLSSPQPVQAH
jgi:aryl-alcohol dehydrogenase-like predicted oxidoreductase